jgi:hypothetical protein
MRAMCGDGQTCGEACGVLQSLSHVGSGTRDNGMPGESSGVMVMNPKDQPCHGKKRF